MIQLKGRCNYEKLHWWTSGKVQYLEIEAWVFYEYRPRVIAKRQDLFPDGEPDTDTFVIKMTEYVKRQLTEANCSDEK